MKNQTEDPLCFLKQTTTRFLVQTVSDKLSYILLTHVSTFLWA